MVLKNKLGIENSAELARLEEQVQKKKANLQIEAAIERTKQLKENIETANL